jgi:hypothetical protein
VEDRALAVDLGVDLDLGVEEEEGWTYELDSASDARCQQVSFTFPTRRR